MDADLNDFTAPSNHQVDAALSLFHDTTTGSPNKSFLTHISTRPLRSHSLSQPSPRRNHPLNGHSSSSSSSLIASSPREGSKWSNKKVVRGVRGVPRSLPPKLSNPKKGKVYHRNVTYSTINTNTHGNQYNGSTIHELQQRRNKNVVLSGMNGLMTTPSPTLRKRKLLSSSSPKQSRSSIHTFHNITNHSPTATKSMKRNNIGYSHSSLLAQPLSQSYSPRVKNPSSQKLRKIFSKTIPTPNSTTATTSNTSSATVNNIIHSTSLDNQKNREHVSWNTLIQSFKSCLATNDTPPSTQSFAMQTLPSAIHTLLHSNNHDGLNNRLTEQSTTDATTATSPSSPITTVRHVLQKLRNEISLSNNNTTTSSLSNDDFYKVLWTKVELDQIIKEKENASPLSSSTDSTALVGSNGHSSIEMKSIGTTVAKVQDSVVDNVEIDPVNPVNTISSADSTTNPDVGATSSTIVQDADDTSNPTKPGKQQDFDLLRLVELQVLMRMQLLTMYQQNERSLSLVVKALHLNKTKKKKIKKRKRQEINHTSTTSFSSSTFSSSPNLQILNNDIASLLELIPFLLPPKQEFSQYLQTLLTPLQHVFVQLVSFLQEFFEVNLDNDIEADEDIDDDIDGYGVHGNPAAQDDMYPNKKSKSSTSSSSRWDTIVSHKRDENKCNQSLSTIHITTTNSQQQQHVKEQEQYSLATPTKSSNNKIILPQNLVQTKQKSVAYLPSKNPLLGSKGRYVGHHFSNHVSKSPNIFRQINKLNMRQTSSSSVEMGGKVERMASVGSNGSTCNGPLTPKRNTLSVASDDKSKNAAASVVQVESKSASTTTSKANTNTTNAGEKKKREGRKVKSESVHVALRASLWHKKKKRKKSR